jgi:type II secretory pathway pseudopilin PulG
MRLRSYSLIEISIVLIILSILTGLSVKGFDLLEQAKSKSTIAQIQNLIISLEQYRQQYGYFPGDDPSVVQRFDSATPGNGDHHISESESAHVFDHLIKGGLWSSKTTTPKIGGIFKVISVDPMGVCIVLCNQNNQGFLSQKNVDQLTQGIDSSHIKIDTHSSGKMITIPMS